MIMAQYDINKDYVSFFRIDFIKFSDEGEIEEFRHRGKVFNREELRKYITAGFIYFYLGNVSRPVEAWYNDILPSLRSEYGEGWMYKTQKTQMRDYSEDED